MCNFTGMMIGSMAFLLMVFFGIIYIIITGEMNLMSKNPTLSHFSTPEPEQIQKFNQNHHSNRNSKYQQHYRSNTQQKHTYTPGHNLGQENNKLQSKIAKGCRLPLDCEFQSGSTKIFLDCNKSIGQCVCEWPELFQHFETPKWQLYYNAREEKCTISTNGPCGYYKGITISCTSRNRCIDGFCKLTSREF